MPGKKQRKGQPLSPLEAQIASVLEGHPEYHAGMDDPAALERDFRPEDGQSNPYLHLSLHLTIRDQVGTDRPAGIAALFRQIADRCGDQHAAEHVLLECLGTTLWEAQRSGSPPDERSYLERVRTAAGNR